MNLALFITVFTLLIVNSECAQVAHNCPTLFQRYCTDHSYCLPRNSSCEILAYYPTNDDIALILQLHNQYRSMVALGTQGFSPASNMMELEWDDELAAVAQNYAEQCLYKHDHSNCRRVMNFGVGQNLAQQTLTGGQTAPQPDWNFAVSIWYSEIIYFQANDICPFHQPTGGEYRHFSQLIWATTFRVGCGYVLYKTDQTLTRLYVCNYGPMGNIYDECVYEAGNPCTNCPVNSCCGSSCGNGNTYAGLCKKTDSSPPLFLPPPNLFYCSFLNEPDCDNFIKGNSNWQIQPALSGNYLEIVLNGGENSTITFKKLFKPTGAAFCISLKYRKGPSTNGQEDANQASEVISVPEIGYTYSQPLITYPYPDNQQFSNYNFTLSLDKTSQFALNFYVPPGKPAQFFDIQQILIVNGECQNTA